MVRGKEELRGGVAHKTTQRRQAASVEVCWFLLPKMYCSCYLRAHFSGNIKPRQRSSLTRVKKKYVLVARNVFSIPFSIPSLLLESMAEACVHLHKTWP